MKYSREKLNLVLDSFKSQEIADVYYYGCKYYDENRNVNNISKSIIEDSFGAILISFSSGKVVNITSTDYEPYYGLGGIKVVEEEIVRMDEDRPSQINEESWIKYKNKSILEHTIIESTYIKRGEEFTIPFGMSLSFSNNDKLYIFNLDIEKYIPETKRFSFIRGGDALTILFSNEDILEYNLLSDIKFEL